MTDDQELFEDFNAYDAALLAGNVGAVLSDTARLSEAMAVLLRIRNDFGIEYFLKTLPTATFLVEAGSVNTFLKTARDRLAEERQRLSDEKYTIAELLYCQSKPTSSPCPVFIPLLRMLASPLDLPAVFLEACGLELKRLEDALAPPIDMACIAAVLKTAVIAPRELLQRLCALQEELKDPSCLAQFRVIFADFEDLYQNVAKELNIHRYPEEPESDTVDEDPPTYADIMQEDTAVNDPDSSAVGEPAPAKPRKKTKQAAATATSSKKSSKSRKRPGVK